MEAADEKDPEEGTALKVTLRMGFRQVITDSAS